MGWHKNLSILRVQRIEIKKYDFSKISKILAGICDIHHSSIHAIMHAFDLTGRSAQHFLQWLVWLRVLVSTRYPTRQLPESDQQQ